MVQTYSAAVWESSAAWLLAEAALPAGGAVAMAPGCCVARRVARCCGGAWEPGPTEIARGCQPVAVGEVVGKCVALGQRQPLLPPACRWMMLVDDGREHHVASGKEDQFRRVDAEVVPLQCQAYSAAVWQLYGLAADTQARQRKEVSPLCSFYAKVPPAFR